MADPLTISFVADTSRAQSAMASLAASVVGNMTSAAVAMSGAAANTNALGGSLAGLQQNFQRVAGVVSADARKIGDATIAAATAEKASLEGIVRSFVATAAASETARTSVRAGLAATGAAISGVLAQVPTLGLLLRGFIAFEAAKLVFNAVSASIDEARQHVESFTSIVQAAEKVGVGANVYPRLTLDAKALGLETQQVVAALERARAASEVKIGEGEHGRTTSAIADRVEQNVRAGNLSRSDQAQLTNAETQEQRIRAVLDLIDKLRAAGRDAAAFDLTGKFFGPDFEAKLRQGVELTRRLRDQMDSTSTTAGNQRIVNQEEINRAEALEAKLKDINSTFATALVPIQRDFSNSALDAYNNFLDFERTVARAVVTASNLYVEISRVADKISDMIPSSGQLATNLGAARLGEATGLNRLGPAVRGALSSGANALGLGDVFGVPRAGETQAQADRRNEISTAEQVLKYKLGQPGAIAQALEDTDKIDFRTPPRRPDRSNNLVSLHPKSSSGGSESLDAVETLINQIEKARDTAKAELENVEKTNVEREKAVALAKAEAAAREDVKRGKRDSAELTEDERTRVLAAAEAWQTYKDRVLDAQQAQRQAADAARYFSEAAASGLADAVLEGKSFNDILNSITKQIFRSGLQAAFTGQGPLAGLLGTAPTASSGDTVGGIAGLLKGAFSMGGSGPVQGPTTSGATLDTVAGGSFLSLLFGGFRASGGPVQAGRPYTVGEMGREMFVPDRNGSIVPIRSGGAGGASFTDSRAITIDARGSTMSEGQFRGIVNEHLGTYDRELQRTFGQRLAGWRQDAP